MAYPPSPHPDSHPPPRHLLEKRNKTAFLEVGHLGCNFWKPDTYKQLGLKVHEVHGCLSPAQKGDLEEGVGGPELTLWIEGFIIFALNTNLRSAKTKIQRYRQCGSHPLQDLGWMPRAAASHHPLLPHLIPIGPSLNPFSCLLDSPLLSGQTSPHPPPPDVKAQRSSNASLSLWHFPGFTMPASLHLGSLGSFARPQRDFPSKFLLQLLSLSLLQRRKSQRAISRRLRATERSRPKAIAES